MADSRIMVRAMVLSGILMFILSAYLFQHIHILSLTAETLELERKIEKTKQENRKLEAALAKETSLENIDKLAETKLKMIRPEKVEFIIYSAPEAEGPDKK